MCDFTCSCPFRHYVVLRLMQYKTMNIQVCIDRAILKAIKNLRGLTCIKAQLS
jgi:hypothetical protein